MFERYTESARRALFFARYAVSELGAASIQTEHLLFGLLRQEKGIVARILRMRGIDPEAMRREIEQRRTRPSIATSMEVPFDADVKRALEHAREEADRLQHSYIGTEHLLLGLLRNEQSAAGSMLAARGLHLDDARALVVKLLAEGTRADTEGAGYSPEREDAVARIGSIGALVQQLAEAATDTPDVQQLIARIDENLEVLKRYFRGAYGEVRKH